MSHSVKFGCHLELDEGMEPDACVKDTNEDFLCTYAGRLTSKWNCPHWKLITRKEPN